MGAYLHVFRDHVECVNLCLHMVTMSICCHACSQEYAGVCLYINNSPWFTRKTLYVSSPRTLLWSLVTEVAFSVTKPSVLK